MQRLITIPEGTPSIIVHEKLMAEKLLKGDIPVPAEGSILPDSYSFERGEQRAAVLRAHAEGDEGQTRGIMAKAVVGHGGEIAGRSGYSGRHCRERNGIGPERRTVAGCIQQSRARI